MEIQRKDFDEFLKKVIARDSHPIGQSLLTKQRIMKIFLIDSMISGVLFGMFTIISEIRVKEVIKSWKLSGFYLILMLSTSLISSLQN